MKLINYIASKRKPIIMSTGMATKQEIKNAIKEINKFHKKIIILHCVSSYPTELKNTNLKKIQQLKKSHKKYLIGLSDHTNDIKIPIYGVLLGARIIEKHIKINHQHKCVDSKVSITGEQLKKLRNEVDSISKILNTPKFGVRPEEIGTKIFKRKKIFNNL